MESDEPPQIQAQDDMSLLMARSNSPRLRNNRRISGALASPGNIRR